MSRHPGVKVLVNNAGIVRFEPLERRRNLAVAGALVTTNLLRPIRLIDPLIEHLAT